LPFKRFDLSGPSDPIEKAAEMTRRLRPQRLVKLTNPPGARSPRRRASESFGRVVKETLHRLSRLA
jgi:hypothetical protein